MSDDTERLAKAKGIVLNWFAGLITAEEGMEQIAIAILPQEGEGE